MNNIGSNLVGREPFIRSRCNRPWDVLEMFQMLAIEKSMTKDQDHSR